MAMWRRRASYDPMKAAAEGKKKLEAKKVSQQASKPNCNERCVLLLQFHNIYHINLISNLS